VFPVANHPAIDYINKGYSVVLKGSGKSSRMLYFVFNSVGDLYDCGLRIRVTSERRNQRFSGKQQRQIKTLKL
jgi:hypothetical protein